MIDLLVAGGGPAGLATALHARRAGMRVVVVEPREAPIDKACGEGLMPGAVSALARLGVSVPGVPLAGIRYLDGRHTVAAAFRRGSGRGVRRTDLHRALHDAALAAGVEFASGRVEEIRQDTRSVSADGLYARHLVAADGLHSRIRRTLDLQRAPAARARIAPRWGVRAHFDCAVSDAHVEVHWAAHSEAYVTPIAPHCVGVAVLGSRREPFADRLRAFPALTARLAGPPVDRVLAAGPLRQDVGRRTHGRVLLVGDAAGYLDALTGEGLAIAFACAQAAVARMATDSVARYDCDYLDISRRYRLLTRSLLWAARRPALRPRIVPTAARLPGVFSAAVDQLAR